jgi:hypothetical protein
LVMISFLTLNLLSSLSPPPFYLHFLPSSFLHLYYLFNFPPYLFPFFDLVFNTNLFSIYINPSLYSFLNFCFLRYFLLFSPLPLPPFQDQKEYQISLGNYVKETSAARHVLHILYLGIQKRKDSFSPGTQPESTSESALIICGSSTTRVYHIPVLDNPLSHRRERGHPLMYFGGNTVSKKKRKRENVKERKKRKITTDRQYHIGPF